MPNKFHISPKTHKAEKCVAETRSCSYGPHFDSLKNAQSYLEKQFEDEYVKKSKSVELAKNKMIEDIVSKKYIDPELSGIIKASLSKKNVSIKTNLSYKNFPAKFIRQSAKTRQETDGLRRDYSDLIEKVKDLKPAERMSMLYQSKDAIDSDFNLLKNSIRDSKINSDVVYINHDKTGAFVLESVSEIDTKQLQEDLAKAYASEEDIDRFMNTTTSLSVPKVREQLEKLGKNPRLYFDQYTNYMPDPKSYSGRSPDAIKTHYSKEDLEKRTDAEKRALLCETGMLKKQITERIIDEEKELSKPDKNGVEGSFFKNTQGELYYKTRASNVINEDKVKALFKKKDIPLESVSNVKKTFVLDKLKSESRKFELAPYKYIRPRRNMYFRDLEHGDISGIMNKKKTAFTEKSL
jgi:hypothetical protein